MTYHPSRSRLGTRDLYESIERDRLRRQMRARLWVLAIAFVTIAAAYCSGLGLALALDTIRHLFIR